MKKSLFLLLILIGIGAHVFCEQPRHEQYQEKLDSLKKRIAQNQEMMPLNQTPILNEALDLIQATTADLKQAQETKAPEKKNKKEKKKRVRKPTTLLEGDTKKIIPEETPQPEKKHEQKELKPRAVKKIEEETEPFILDRYYALPSWPFNANFYRENDMFQLFLSYEGATKAFSSSGHEQDVSSLEFAKTCIRLQDILLVSKLAKAGNLTLQPEADYLSALAEQLILFNGSVDTLKAHVGYSRHFFENKLAFGILIPFIYKKHTLRINTPDIDNKLTAVQKTNLNSAYDEGFTGLFKDILAKKGIDYSEDNSESGLSDMEIFIHYNIPKIADQFYVGLNTIWPTAQKCNCSVLWDPKLGNGGFTQIAPFAAIRFENGNLFNPHAYGSIKYSFPAHVNKRVAKFTNATITSVADAKKYIKIFSDKIKSVKEGGFTLCDFDSTVRSFADESHCLRISPGLAGELILGNQFVFKNLFFDLFYHLRGKGSDSIGGTLPECNYNKDQLKHQTFVVDHRIGCDFDYQMSADNRLNIGVLYTVAGRNTPKAFEVYTAFNFEF